MRANRHDLSPYHLLLLFLQHNPRIFTDNLDGTLNVLKKLVGQEPGFRVPFRDMEVLVIGDFCILAGPADSIKPQGKRKKK